MKNALTPWLRRITVAVLLIAPSALAQTAPATEVSPSYSEDEKSTDLPPSKERCIESHRQCQQVQKQGKFLEARELARTCTNLACPGLLVSDCARWLADLDQRIPSVVFEVRLDGEPNGEAKVFADGTPVAEWTRGESLRLDPGKHQFRFELGKFEPIVQSLFLAEGMRYRIVGADFRTPTQSTVAPKVVTPPVTQPTPMPPPPRERPTPVVVYPLLGVGVLGAIGFGTFAVLGKSKEDDLKDTCSPDCSDSDKDEMKRNYLIGDISLGIGAASFIAAGVVYFTRPEKEATPTIAITPLPGGVAGVASYRF